LACTKNNPNTNVKIANGEGDGAAESARAPGAPTRPTPRTDLQKIRMSGSVVGVADMLDAAGKLITMWSPPEPGAPAANLQSMLVRLLGQEGFGPGFLGSSARDGVHGVECAVPDEGRPGAAGPVVELRLASSAHQPVRAIESLPSELQPQPIGQNVW